MINYKYVIKYVLLLVETFVANVLDNCANFIQNSIFGRIVVIVIVSAIIVVTLNLFKEKPAFEPDEVA